ncbi:MAG: tetratricopeptide repeat protein [Bacteroidota bacterium]
MKKHIILLGMVWLAIACNTKPESEEITRVADYNGYLDTQNTATWDQALDSKEFWSKRLRPDSSGVGDLAPLAGAYEQLFNQSGNSQFLCDAESLYEKGMAISAQGKDGFARGLARNYISQHRFEEAYKLLQETFAGPSNKRETQLQLFDAAMEVGDYEAAYTHLEAVKDFSDYHYLIRLSKWSDYRGDLDNAIKYIEQAMAIAESRDNRALRIWTYSNLADYYGHAGRISDSYQHYLKTLALQPDNAYAKKGIAWILYSEEKNTSEAHRVLDSIMKTHQLPDYFLLKAELFEFESKQEEATNAMRRFLSSVSSGNYGGMYNTYLIEYYAEEDPEKANWIVQKELKNRATPEIYHLLALVQLNKGEAEQALETITNHVEGKTYEPMALYHSALVYKANKQMEKVTEIREELLEAAYELGPLLAGKIEALTP